MHGYTGFFVYLDHVSDCSRVFFVKKKGSLPNTFVKYYKSAKVQYGHVIKRIQCDNGGEYTSEEMKNITAKRGIKFERTASGTPQENGKAECVI